MRLNYIWPMKEGDEVTIYTHQLWLSVESNKPSKPGYVNSAMYLAKKVKIKNKYKSYSATWVLI